MLASKIKEIKNGRVIVKDSKVGDGLSESEMDKKQLAKGNNYKIILPSGQGEPLYTNSFNAAKEMAKEYGKGTQVVNMGFNIYSDSKTKDSFYDVFAKRDGRRQKFNNKPLILEEANELVEHINKAGIPSVEKGSAERVIIMDSKTKDEKVISISTPQWEGDIRIIDSTHFEMKEKSSDGWTWALHIAQADDHILNALKAKGALKDKGRFFN